MKLKIGSAIRAAISIRNMMEETTYADLVGPNFLSRAVKACATCDNGITELDVLDAYNTLESGSADEYDQALVAEFEPEIRMCKIFEHIAEGVGYGTFHKGMIYEHQNPKDNQKASKWGTDQWNTLLRLINEDIPSGVPAISLSYNNEKIQVHF